MTTELDQKFLPLVTRLLDRFGKNVTFKIRTGTTFNTLTGERTAGTIVEYVRKVSPPSKFERFFSSNEASIEADLEVLLAAEGLTFALKKSDIVEIDSSDYEILQIEPIYSGELVCAYRLMLKGA